jgi:hypothetical protein
MVMSTESMDGIPRMVWDRFRQKTDNGHDDYCTKADLCWRYLFGHQWSKADLQRLKEQRRPAMTVNKIKPTIKVVLSEQIFNRVEYDFVPRSSDAADETANILTKVAKQISDNNSLSRLRTAMFLDGQVTSRGFLDMRMAFDDNMQGEVRFSLLNPKNVVIDGDAESYDPDGWNDVTIAKWQTYNDIAVLYSEAKAKKLENRDTSYYFGQDSIDYVRMRFGDMSGSDANWTANNPKDGRNWWRNIRTLDHQYRKLDKQEHFVSAMGDTRQVPVDWDRNRIAAFMKMTGFNVINKLVRRIRWAVVADDVVLFDEWSPYNHFTVIPYFPLFAHGVASGTVEDLLNPQDILNKVSSQELHVINTTANSGYKVVAGKLSNMTPDELREQGAQTGIVIEVKDDIKNIEKITPNQVPQGLDRVSDKAENNIKSISGINDGMTGFVREDVAAKAIDKNKQSGQAGLAVDLDNLKLTDKIIARNMLECVQTFYTEERIMYITKDSTTNEQESFAINQAAAGRIVNDLTLGEYGVVVTSVPERESLQDAEFEQALALRQQGVQMIDDETLIMSSRLRNKGELIRKSRAQAESPEAQASKQRKDRMEEATVKKAENDAANEGADAGLRQAKTQEILNPPPPEAKPAADPSKAAQVQVNAQGKSADIDQKEREMAFDQQMEVQNQKRADDELALKAQTEAQKLKQDQVKQAQQQAAAALSGSKRQE